MPDCAHVYHDLPFTDNGTYRTSYVRICACGDVAGYLVPDATLTQWDLVVPTCPTCSHLVDALCADVWHQLFAA